VFEINGFSPDIKKHVCKIKSSLLLIHYSIAYAAYACGYRRNLRKYQMCQDKLINAQWIFLGGGHYCCWSVGNLSRRIMIGK